MYEGLAGVNTASINPEADYYLRPEGLYKIADRNNYEQVKDGGGRQILKGSALIPIINQKTEEAFSNRVRALTQPQIDALQAKVDQQLSQEKTYNSLAEQIKSLTGGESGYTAGGAAGPAGPAFNQALAQLSASRNYGSSDIGTMLNFQVSDQQIVDDYNNSRSSKLDDIIKRGNTQIAGIQERLNTANELLAGLPAKRCSQNFIQCFR